MFVYVHLWMLSPVLLFVTPWSVACQVPLSMKFSRQEYWTRLPFPTRGDLCNPGIKSMSLASPALAGGFFTTVPPGKPINLIEQTIIFPNKENTDVRDFPGGPVARTPQFQCRLPRFNSL